MGVFFNHRGSFKNTETFLKRYNVNRMRSVLEKYGQKGVSALSSATPRDSGSTADSWAYGIDISKQNFSIYWYNTNLTSAGTPVAILLQYGHATKNGGYVQGADYINPAIVPIFDEIAEAVWREVTM